MLNSDSVLWISNNAERGKDDSLSELCRSIKRSDGRSRIISSAQKTTTEDDLARFKLRF